MASWLRSRSCGALIGSVFARAIQEFALYLITSADRSNVESVKVQVTGRIRHAQQEEMGSVCEMVGPVGGPLSWGRWFPWTPSSPRPNPRRTTRGSWEDSSSGSKASDLKMMQWRVECGQEVAVDKMPSAPCGNTADIARPQYLTPPSGRPTLAHEGQCLSVGCRASKHGNCEALNHYGGIHISGSRPDQHWDSSMRSVVQHRSCSGSGILA